MVTALDPKPVIVALDYPSMHAALALADRISPAICRVKVGKELFTRAGPEVVRALVARGFEVFLDLKFHDIPTTVANACEAAADLGVWMLNVHAGGGPRMLEAARTRLGDAAAPLLVAVTVLTSLDDAALRAVGVESTAEQQVLRLAHLAQACGMDGVVCSPRELPALRAVCHRGFKLVTPGIRRAGQPADDQVRTADPTAAIVAGATYLVVGRPVTAAPDPAQALAAIHAEAVAAGVGGVPTS